ncbi:MAG: sugar kinase [Sphingomonadales bacterium]|nr:sugar kinase [Sphingomonadales bacterium]
MLELSGFQTDTCTVSVAGDTFNTAVYLARHGLEVTYATSLGLDPISDLILSKIQGEGIDTSMILRAPGAPGMYAISVDEVGERSFTYWRANSVARQFFTIAGVDRLLERALDADMLYLSGITLSLFGMADLVRLRDLAAAMRSAGKVVAFDTNYRQSGWQSAEHAREAIGLISPFVSMALPTFEDEALLHGDAKAEQTAQRWLDLGAEEVVVKQGAQGAYVAGHDWVMPPAKVVPRDTTGAGDSFNGAYISARIAGAHPRIAARMGHELAARVIMTPGAILPRDAEVQ